MSLMERQVTLPNSGDCADGTCTVSVDWNRQSPDRPTSAASTTRRITKNQRADLRDYYSYQLSEFRSERLVYVGGFSCGQQTGFRRTAWSHRGVTPAQISHRHRERPCQVLLAYTQDGVLLSRVFQGSMGSGTFEDFMEQLLHHCGRWPESKAVLIMKIRLTIVQSCGEDVFRGRRHTAVPTALLTWSESD
jgi:hypothetical protein